MWRKNKTISWNRLKFQLTSQYKFNHLKESMLFKLTIVQINDLFQIQTKRMSYTTSKFRKAAMS
jgi:hypothetical protein